MANINLVRYNLSELRGLQHDVETEIATRQRQHMENARQRILAIADEAGLSVEELFAESGRKPKSSKRQTAKVRFQNSSENSGSSIGRGRYPEKMEVGICPTPAVQTWPPQSCLTAVHFV